MNKPKNRRIRGSKIGAARWPQVWGRGFTTPKFNFKWYYRNWVHFAALFLGPQDGPFFAPNLPVQPDLVGCAPALARLVPVTLDSVILSTRGLSEAVARASLYCCSEAELQARLGEARIACVLRA